MSLWEKLEIVYLPESELKKKAENKDNWSIKLWKLQIDNNTWLPKMFTLGTKTTDSDWKIISANIELNKEWIHVIYLNEKFKNLIDEVNVFMHADSIDYTTNNINVKMVLQIKLNDDIYEIEKVKNTELYKLLDEWNKEKLFNLDLPVIFLSSLNESYKWTNDKTLWYMYKMSNKNKQWLKEITSINFRTQWYYRKYVVWAFTKGINDINIKCVKRYRRRASYSKEKWCHKRKTT